MTNPTADAIAALKLAAERIRISSDAYRDRGDDAGAESDLLAAAHLDEVRSALLSAQGQAGKPDDNEGLRAWVDRATKAERERDTARSLVERTLATLAQHTELFQRYDAREATARTALEAADKALDEDLTMTAAGIIEAALATIKGLET